MGGDRRQDAAADVVEIEQLVLGEREAITRGWWNQASKCYEEDARVDLVDFRGTARDYLEHRRWDFARGSALRWRLHAPVVHLNVERAVAIADGVVTWLGVDVVERVELDVTLVVRVRRWDLTWLIAAIDGLLWEQASTASDRSHEGREPVLPHRESWLSGEGPMVFGGERTANDDPGSSSRYEELLAWAGLTPGLDRNG